jgi:hypothetical protein
MDSITNLIVTLLAALVAALLLGWLGFLLKSPVHAPQREAVTRPLPIPLPRDLPPSLYHFFEKNYGTLIYPPATVVAWGRGQIIARRFGRLGPLWAPFSWTIDLMPGKNFVMTTRITWWRRNYIRGGEEYREGKGRFTYGKNSVKNPHIDRSEQTLLWLYTILLAPTTILLEPDITCQKGEEDDSVCIRIPFSEEDTRSFVLHFDPETGQIARIDTFRTASRDGRLVPFKFVLEAPHSFGDDLIFPGRISVAWEEDPYVQYEIKGVNFNVDVSTAMEEGIP